MADQFVIVQTHLINATAKYTSAADAAVDAAKLVEKDRIPRTVLRVISNVCVSATPKVDIVQIAEVCGG